MITLHGNGSPSSLRVTDPRGRGQTMPIHSVTSREAEDIILNFLADANGMDPHRETWPLRKYGQAA